MNILFLAHRIPFPPDKGDKIRSFNEIKYLSKKNSIYLGTILDEKTDVQYIDALRAYCIDIYAVSYRKKLRILTNILSTNPFSVTNFYSPKLQKHVDNILHMKNIDVIFCFCSSMAEYVFKSKYINNANNKRPILIMDFVDLDSDKWLQYVQYTIFPLSFIYKEENRRLFKYEIKINLFFDHSLFVCQREVDVFLKLYPEAQNIRIMPNGVNFEYFSPYQPSLSILQETQKLNSERKSIQQPRLVFTGAMDYFANVDGVIWFCNKILPIIKNTFPDVQFYIVGKQPSRIVRRLEEIPGVTVTGNVDDIRIYYWMADICVIPLRIARGLQNKVLEAMATGNAVVTTSNASGGIVCSKNEDLVIADDEISFAKEVINLLVDENKRKEMGRKAFKNIKKNYSWDDQLQNLEDLLKN